MSEEEDYKPPKIRATANGFCVADLDEFFNHERIARQVAECNKMMIRIRELQAPKGKQRSRQEQSSTDE